MRIIIIQIIDEPRIFVHVAIVLKNTALVLSLLVQEIAYKCTIYSMPNFQELSSVYLLCYVVILCLAGVGRLFCR